MFYNNGTRIRIIIAICEIIVGILLLTDPQALAAGIAVCIGLGILLYGFKNIVLYFTTEPKTSFAERKMKWGIIQVIIGIICVINTGWLMGAFSALTFIYGIIILIVGIGKAQTAVSYAEYGIKKWIWTALAAALTIICALIIIFNPFGSTIIIWTFIGASLIVQAILDLIGVAFLK